MATIFIADDNDEMRDSLEQFLRKEGHKVIAHDDGRWAWNRLRRGEIPDIIISDYRMPRLNGLDFLVNVRTGLAPNTESLPFILISSEDTDFSGGSLEEACKTLNAHFLRKNSLGGVDGLIDLIAELLAK